MERVFTEGYWSSKSFQEFNLQNTLTTKYLVSPKFIFSWYLLPYFAVNMFAKSEVNVSTDPWSEWVRKRVHSSAEYVHRWLNKRDQYHNFVRQALFMTKYSFSHKMIGFLVYRFQPKQNDKKDLKDIFCYKTYILNNNRIS